MTKGNPPKHGQFGRGMNKPNLKGRPKGSRNQASEVREFAEMMHKTQVNGEVIQCTTVLRLIRKVHMCAMQGNISAMRLLDLYLDLYMHKGSTGRPVIVVPEEVTPEEWIAEIERENLEMDRLMREELEKRQKKEKA